MPRPYLPIGLAKEKKLEVRVSEAELKAIRNFADSQGMTISTLFRTTLKKYAKGLKNNEKTTRKVTFPDTF